MISNAEISRYHDYAELKIRRNFGSPEEQHLASMVVNLVRVIDHLVTCMASQTSQGPCKEGSHVDCSKSKWVDCTCPCHTKGAA